MTNLILFSDINNKNKHSSLYHLQKTPWKIESNPLGKRIDHCFWQNYHFSFSAKYFFNTRFCAILTVSLHIPYAIKWTLRFIRIPMSYVWEILSKFGLWKFSLIHRIEWLSTIKGYDFQNRFLKNPLGPLATIITDSLPTCSRSAISLSNLRNMMSISNFLPEIYFWSRKRCFSLQGKKSKNNCLWVISTTFCNLSRGKFQNVVEIVHKAVFLIFLSL